VLDPLLGAVDRLAQPRLLDRLEQVVHRVDLAGPHRVFVVSRAECDQRHLLLFQHTHDADAVELWHLQVEQRPIVALALDPR